nr:Iron-sulfur assembly protein IscA-like 1, mitochondrial [Ipomoea batatas]
MPSLQSHLSCNPACEDAQEKLLGFDEVYEQIVMGSPESLFDLPPESFWVPKGSEQDWVHQNANMQRRTSMKLQSLQDGFSGADSKSQSHRSFSAALNKSSSLLALPKPRNPKAAAGTRLFRSMSEPGGGGGVMRGSDPVSPKSDLGYEMHSSAKPFSIWLSSRNAPSDWSTVPETTCPAQEEQEPARHDLTLYVAIADTLKGEEDDFKPGFLEVLFSKGRDLAPFVKGEGLSGCNPPTDSSVFFFDGSVFWKLELRNLDTGENEKASSELNGDGSVQNTPAIRASPADFPQAWHEKEKFDELVEDKGVKILIDPKALMHVIGTQMDFVDDKLRSEFIFINPNSAGQCGCGESFMTKTSAEAAKLHGRAGT